MPSDAGPRHLCVKKERVQYHWPAAEGIHALSAPLSSHTSARGRILNQCSEASSIARLQFLQISTDEAIMNYVSWTEKEEAVYEPDL